MSDSVSCLKMLLKMLRAILESKEVFDYEHYFQVVKDIPIFNILMKKSYNTLELFSFGSISDYIFGMKNYLKLSPLAIAKLRILTMLTLADIYDEVDLTFLSVQLRAGTKQETLNLLLETCQLGVITIAVNFQTEKVQFFSVRKRNTDVILLDRLVKVKDAIREMIANRSMIFMLPLHYEFTDFVQRVVTTAINENEESLSAEAELLEFLVRNAVKQRNVEVSAATTKLECPIESGTDGKKKKNPEETAYDADEEKENDEESMDAGKLKKPKKKSKKDKHRSGHTKVFLEEHEKSSL